MAKKNAWVPVLRDCLVILSTILMIAMTILQWQEITVYNIKDHMWKTIKGWFVSEQAAAPAVPAASEQPQEAPPAQ
jgi:hypothetical protein